MNLAQPLVAADNRPPSITNLHAARGRHGPGGRPPWSPALSDDRGGAGVDPNTVRIMISGRNVTPDAQVTSDSFTYRAPLPPGRHTVDVTARDNAGQYHAPKLELRGRVRPGQVPIQILSHVNNGQVDGNVTHIRGRTAPVAEVNVRVDAVPPVVGQFGVAQNVFSRTVQADPNGHFDFSFSSPSPSPGTRYDIVMKAHKADVTTEAKLVLYQRQG